MVVFQTGRKCSQHTPVTMFLGGAWQILQGFYVDSLLALHQNSFVCFSLPVSHLKITHTQVMVMTYRTSTLLPHVRRAHVRGDS